MRPELREGLWVFTTLPARDVPPGLRPLMVFEEAEGTTLILARDEADAHGIAAAFPCRMITLNIHSALDAVGFIARIATALAEAGMGVNPVAAFHHDHLFVPAGRAEEAMAVLEAMAG
jgi:hypothetical protein